MTAREQRFVFGEVAELYDRTRPEYPDEVFDRIVDLSGAVAPARVLEVGVGTGKATAPLAARGFEVTGLEPNVEMAAVARRNLATVANVTLVASSFEDWDLERGAFALVVSATAWHWVTPGVRLERAHAALRPHGALAFFSVRHRWPVDPVTTAIDAVYARVAPACTSRLPGSPRQESRWVACIAEVETSPWFDEVRQARISQRDELDRQGFVDRLRTQSDHRLLAPDVLERLLDGIGQVIDDVGGTVTVDRDTVLVVARRAA